jgi:hypothetical protein
MLLTMRLASSIVSTCAVSLAIQPPKKWSVDPHRVSGGIISGLDVGPRIPVEAQP